MRCAQIGVATLVLAISPLTLTAQVRTFPYEAVVQTAGVPVLSGPGFYATNKSQKGDRVVVHRHDPGGWFMISPPGGEFSLIRAEDATVSNGSAVIEAEESFVRIGSRLSDDFGVEQVPLARGDRVELVTGVQAPPGWIAVKPPRGEYRWISGRFLVPADQMTRSAQDADPFAVPSTAARPEAFELVEAEATPRDRKSSPSPGPSLTLGSPEQIEYEGETEPEVQKSLRLLDRELEGLSLSEPTEWPLSRLEAGYQNIKENRPSLGRQIDVRLSQISKMRVVQSHYRDYVQLTSATDERDAALVARQGTPPRTGIVHADVLRDREPKLTLAPPLQMAAKPVGRTPAAPVTAPPAQPAPKASSGPHLLGLVGQPQHSPAPLPVPNRPTTPQPVNAVAPSAVPRPAPGATAMPAPPALPPEGPQRFGAVGLVQKSTTPQSGGPSYVLVSPQGGIVAYLQTKPGISLDQFIGQPMGVDGAAQRQPPGQAPMIAVEKLTPVRF